jgi:hypothetical protein
MKIEFAVAPLFLVTVSAKNIFLPVDEAGRPNSNVAEEADKQYPRCALHCPSQDR